MKKNFFIFFISLAFLIIILIPGARRGFGAFVNDFSSPLASSLSKISSKISGSTSTVFKVREISRQNKELAEKLAGIEVDRSKILELEKENEILKNELKFFQKEKEDSLIPARIVIREPTTFLDYIVVDKGKKDGVMKDMAVISQGTLVGIVTESNEDTAKVVLVTSKDSIVQAMLQESRAKGVLRGGIGGLFLDDIVVDTDYKRGDYVVTSGLGGKIKQGILIGKAKDTEAQSSDLYKSIAVEPIVDLSKLEIVFIEK